MYVHAHACLHSTPFTGIHVHCTYNHVTDLNVYCLLFLMRSACCLPFFSSQYILYTVPLLPVHPIYCSSPPSTSYILFLSSQYILYCSSPPSTSYTVPLLPVHPIPFLSSQYILYRSSPPSTSYTVPLLPVHPILFLSSQYILYRSSPPSTYLQLCLENTSPAPLLLRHHSLTADVSTTQLHSQLPQVNRQHIIILYNT